MKSASKEQPLVAQMNKALEPLGFIRKGRTFYRSSATVTQLVDFQKSNWSADYYVNVGLFFRAADPSTERPRPVDCHIRLRVEDLGSDIPATFTESQSEALSEATSRYLVPFLEVASTPAGIRKLYEQGRFRSALLAAAAHEQMSKAI